MDINQNCIVGIDKLGRKVDAFRTGENGKKVGCFFWLWIGQPKASGIYDATEILKLPNGADMLYFKNSPPITPAGQAHFWGEPIWGYYNSDDEWVIRKQLEMLSTAGVDFIVFDATNEVTYFSVYIRIMRIIEELLDEGSNPPLCAFYTHTHSLRTTRNLYNEVYSKNLHPRAWYRVNGKPFIVAFEDPDADKTAEAITIGHFTDYKPEPLPEEIHSFFSFRRPQWPTNNTVYPDGFPWIEWIFPQPIHTDMMSVTVASHPNVPMSFSRTRGLENWGRGWDPDKKENIAADVEKGTFFQRQWDNALAARDALDTVFVGGWNEWIAYKSLYQGEYMLCDAADEEFSRDCEPMRGGYEDSFYLQLIRNVRNFKSNGVPVNAKRKKLTPPSDGWNQAAVYEKIGKAPAVRDSFGASLTVAYTQPAARNTLNTVRVANDNDNLYFRIECYSDYIAADTADGTVLWLGTGEVAEKGYNSYEMCITIGSKAVLCALDASGVRTPICELPLSVAGNTVCVTLPLSKVNANAVYFKVTDSINMESMENTYTSGSAMPMGRLSYLYEIV